MIPLFRVAMDHKNALKHLVHTLAPNAAGDTYIGEGPKVAEFETRCRELLGVPHLLAVNSGTSALRLALELAGARPGTEVVSTPMTCTATNTAIAETKATIVWADVDPLTGLISPEDAARKVTSRTVAVVAVDWAGRLCDFKRLRALVRGVSIIEDAAHALGATRMDPLDRGDLIAWSLQAIKMLTTGDGGLLSCPGAALHERGKLLRWFGLDRTRGDSMRCDQGISEAGFKMQMNDVSACLGLANLPGVADRVVRARQHAADLHAELSQVPYVELAPLPPSHSWAPWFFPLRVSRPIAFESFAHFAGVTASRVHARNDTLRCFDSARGGPLPGVDDFSQHQVNLPVGWWLSPKDLEGIANTVRAWSRQPEARW